MLMLPGTGVSHQFVNRSNGRIVPHIRKKFFEGFIDFQQGKQIVQFNIVFLIGYFHQHRNIIAQIGASGKAPKLAEHSGNTDQFSAVVSESLQILFKLGQCCGVGVFFFRGGHGVCWNTGKEKDACKEHCDEPTVRFHTEKPLFIICMDQAAGRTRQSGYCVTNGIPFSLAYCIEVELGEP